MKHRTSEQLYAYWNEVRGDRIAPQRFDIEPGRIAGLLPQTFILEHTEDDRYCFRLAGTRMCEQFGCELRGTSFLDDWPTGDAETLRGGLRTAAAQGGGLWIDMTATTGELGRSVRCEMLVLPLQHRSAICDRFLGACCALEEPSWLGAELLLHRSLDRMEVIWPNGRPHAVAASHTNQSPFQPHIRYGRLVRSDRRQFRVYDGGLTKTDNGDG